MSQKTVLLLTDFSYQAKGREYFREDIELSNYLRKYFKVCISHMADCEKVIDHVDCVLIRNTGPQMLHEKELAKLRKRKDLVLFNDLAGQGDINGKEHLLKLFKAGYPVIPTFQSREELSKFGAVNRYLMKPLNGADSCGVKIVGASEVEFDERYIIQPVVDFVYEVSFYIIGKQFHYSFYAPNPEKRWELKPYEPSRADLTFAQTFINWNSCKDGIQRVDACRCKNGELLLMELEDYNPFLSLDLLDSHTKIKFLDELCNKINLLLF